MSVQTITPKRREVLRRKEPTVAWIAVRTPEETREVHAEAGGSVPQVRPDPGA